MTEILTSIHGRRVGLDYRNRLIINGSVIEPGSRVPLIAFAGDSITYATIAQNTALITNTVNRGLEHWVCGLLKQRVRTRPDLNFGISGNTSTQLLARIDQVAACDADFVAVLIGTNDLGGTINEALFTNYQNNMMAIYRALNAAGKFVVFVPVLPRSLVDDATRQMMWRFIRFVRSMQFMGLRNFIIADPSLEYVNPTSATADPRTGYAYDGLHPDVPGAYAVGNVIASALTPFVPSVAGAEVASATDIYNATYNPTGNLLTNGILDSTGGNLGSNGAGAIAANWTYGFGSNGGNITSLVATGSKITLANGLPAQRTVLSGAYTGASGGTLDNATVVTFSQSFGSFTNFSIGDVLQASIDLDVAADASRQISIMELRLGVTMGGQAYINADGGGFGLPMPVGAWSTRLLTPKLTLTAVPTVVTVGLRVYLLSGANTASGQFDASAVSLRKVIA